MLFIYKSSFCMYFQNTPWKNLVKTHYFWSFRIVESTKVNWFADVQVEKNTDQKLDCTLMDFCMFIPVRYLKWYSNIVLLFQFILKLFFPWNSKYDSTFYAQLWKNAEYPWMFRKFSQITAFPYTVSTKTTLF